MRSERSPLLSRTGVYVVLTAFALSTVAPFLWMLFASFKNLQEVQQPGILPSQWNGTNYQEVFHQVPFATYYVNSFLVAAWVTFLTVLTSSTGAFAFARMKWRGRDMIFLLYLGTMMVPGVVTIIPNYALMVRLHLLDSFSGLIIPASFSAFGTFLLRQFMRGIPSALDEAATIDGATAWTTFWDVIMPICKPGLAALAILTFLGTYGSFYWPLIIIKSEHLRTLPIGMLFFDGNYGRQTNLIMAAGMMSLLPPFVLFLVGQRQLIRGIQMGAVKG